MIILPRIIRVCAISLAVSGCASSSTIPLAKNLVHISTNAAPFCGSAGARKMALRQAAVETIARGYDSFIIVVSQASSTMVGRMPTTSYSTGSATGNATWNSNAFGGYGSATINGSSTTTTYEGDPIYSHGQGLTVKMFKPEEPGSGNAISARGTLGPDWQKIAAKKKLTCL